MTTTPFFAPCPVSAQHGPNGWVLDAVDGPWVGYMTDDLLTMLTQPAKAWPRNLAGDRVFAGRVGPWAVRVAFDGSLIARLKGRLALPFPLVLTGPTTQTNRFAWSSGKACWDAVDKKWLNHALATIAQSLAPTKAVRIGEHQPDPKAWPLWWIPGTWRNPDQTRTAFEKALRLVAAERPAEDVGTVIHLNLDASTVHRDGSIRPAPTPNVTDPLHLRVLHHFAPFLRTPAAVAHAWTGGPRTPAPWTGKREGITLITPPMGNLLSTLPQVTAHERLQARAS